MNKLLKAPGAIPYLIVVFLNAFVDLGHKITIQNTIFKTYDGSTQIVLTAIINGLILLPFILLFSPSGFIADRFPKNIVMRVAAWAAVIITIGITGCYYLGWFWPAFALTFLLAIQSAIYSPAKYGYIKSLFGKEKLGEANGLVQATTIVAILLGTFAFSIVFESMFPEGANKGGILEAIAPIGWLLVINSLIELVMAYRLPTLEQGDITEKFDTKEYLTGKAVRKNITPITSNSVIRLSVIGLTIFWSVGQVMLAAFPAFAKESLTIDNTIIIQGILAATGLGIAIGSTLAGRWSKGHIETGFIPIGAIGIGAGLILLPQITSATGHFFNFLFIGVMGGFFVVPLNALIQFNANNNELGKVIAGNNLIQNIGMMSFLALTVLFAISGIPSKLLLIIVAVVAIIGSLYTVYKLPQSLVRLLLTGLMTRRYKVNVQGLRNIPSQGGALLLGNHISWIDWAILQIATPRPIRFVMIRSIYERWYLKSLLKMLGCIPIESGINSQKSLETVAMLLDEGEVVCLFPEGSISRTGHLSEFRRGYERACKMTEKNIPIIPFYLRGLWGSQFSRSSDKLQSNRDAGMSRDIIVAFGQALPKDTTADIMKRRIFDLSIEAWQQHVESIPNLPRAWINTVKRVNSEMAIADTLSGTLSATQLLSACIAFSKRIQSISKEDNIGILMPTSTGGVIANMAVLLSGKTVVNLNYSATVSAVEAAIEQAEIKTIYTSKVFLEKLKNKGISIEPALQNCNVVYMEEIKANIHQSEMLRRWLTVKLLPAWCINFLHCQSKDPDKTAAILFSSGSEGKPKGVMLSHRNIMANLKQISDVLNTQDRDVVMASLPLFHAFGMTVTQFMPLVEGIPMVCHADPTDAVGIAKAVAKYRATIFFGTSTLLNMYNRNKKVHPLMLESLRIVVAGAEKLNKQVSDNFQLKFNKSILEGYGATETTPVASVNLPDVLDTNYWHIQSGGKPGTVGMPLPGTSFKILDPDSEQELETGEEGMIAIGGVQIMQGYLNNPEKTSDVIRQVDGQRWYITGDKGRIDKDGFLNIIDRYSRFAKIGGEMVGLSAVEEQVINAINEMEQEKGGISESELELVAINLPDENKGETIAVLVTKELDMSELRKVMLALGSKALTIPASSYVVDEIPKLGSGKTDFVAVKALAQELQSNEKVEHA